jgi:hypothetical protein
LKSSSDRAEIVAAFTALKMSGSVTALFTQADLKSIASWLDAGTQDVRIAAARLLGCFGGDLGAVEALLTRDWDTISFEDYKASVGARSNSRLLKDKVSEFIFSELDHYLSEYRKKTALATQKTMVLLEAARRLRQLGPAALVNRVRAVVEDTRTPTPSQMGQFGPEIQPQNHKIYEELKRCAMLCYPAIAMPSDRTVAVIREWFLHPLIGFDSSLVRVPSIFARQCRESVDYVMACISSLVKLRKDMVAFHKKIAKRDLTDESEYNVTELRQGIFVFISDYCFSSTDVYSGNKVGN